MLKYGNIGEVKHIIPSFHIPISFYVIVKSLDQLAVNNHASLDHGKFVLLFSPLGYAALLSV
jgi:hypothetical protein